MTSFRKVLRHISEAILDRSKKSSSGTSASNTHHLASIWAGLQSGSPRDLLVFEALNISPFAFKIYKWISRKYDYTYFSKSSVCESLWSLALEALNISSFALKTYTVCKFNINNDFVLSPYDYWP